MWNMCAACGEDHQDFPGGLSFQEEIPDVVDQLEADLAFGVNYVDRAAESSWKGKHQIDWTDHQDF